MKSRLLVISLMFIQACSHAPEIPVPRAKDVDLDHFMGDWYVIANIPTFIEKGAHNAIESYAMSEDGSIATTFTFNKNAFDGDLKVFKPVGYVSEQSNSEWGMQFIWPFKAEYIIAYLSEDYQYTVIARTARDYLWIMSRSPIITNEDYEYLVQLCVDMGYSRDEILKIPHKAIVDTKQINHEGAVQ